MLSEPEIFRLTQKVYFLSKANGMSKGTEYVKPLKEAVREATAAGVPKHKIKSAIEIGYETGTDWRSRRSKK